MNDSVYLCVPFAEKDRARALGARWDHGARRWFVPPGHDITAFSRWLDKKPLYSDLGPSNPEADELIESPVILKLMSYPCFRCGASTPVFYALDRNGVEITDDLYRPDIIQAVHLFRLALALPPIGTVKPRSSKSANRQIVSQGCAHCDAIIGDFFLHEEIVAAESASADNPLHFSFDWPPESLPAAVEEAAARIRSLITA